MAKLILLGTSSAVPDIEHDNTHFVLIGETRKVLVDTSNNPTIRLRQAGLDPNDITDLILTHFHPDHVSGVPTLLMNSWLSGRKNELEVYGLAEVNKRMAKVMDLYEWSSWPDFFPVSFHNLPSTEENHLAIESTDFRIFSAPVRHMIPALGLRIESKISGWVIAYSCDTEPCDAVIRLAMDADILIHEASGVGFGHSSAEQAGEIARKAGAKELYLIHYPTGKLYQPEALIAQARQNFSGPVTISQDFMELEF